VRLLLQVDAEVDRAHDAVAELFVDHFLDGAAVHLKGFVEAVDGGVYPLPCRICNPFIPGYL